MFRLDGKVALITGATGGIGGQIARAFSAAGARCAISGRRQDRLEALAGQLPGDTLVCPADLADRAAAGDLIARVEAGLGGIDILVNNAGATRDGLAMRLGDADWDAVIELDLTAAFRLVRPALKGMMRRRFGRIVNIASVVGTTGNPGQANYCAAKAGLVGMTKALARELAGRSITVNAVAPGFIETDMTAGLTDAQVQAIKSTIPAGRLGTAQDVAAGCVFLASNEAAYITGHTLHVNGGMAMV